MVVAPRRCGYGLEVDLQIPQYGIINQLLDANIGWLTDSQIVLITCSVVQIWSNIVTTPFCCWPDLQNISVSLYEAADLDRRVQGPPVLQHHIADGLSHPSLWSSSCV